MAFSKRSWALRTATRLAVDFVYGGHRWVAADDRGREVAIYCYSQNLLTNPDPTRSFTAEEISSLRREVRSANGPMRFFAGSLLIAVGVLQFFVYLTTQPTPGWSKYNMLIFGAVFLYFGMVQFRNLGDKPYMVARALRLRHRCGTCAYDLSGCTPELDGCTICPECGSAWRIP